MRKTRSAADGLVSGVELATHLETNPRTVRKWRTEPGFPVAVRGRGTAPSRYDETAVRAWLQQREGRTHDGTRLLIKARVRKESAIAAESELRYAIRSGAVVPIEDVERTWSGEVAAVRARLLIIPTALSDKLHRIATLDGAAGIEAELQRAIYEVLTEFSTGKTRKPQRSRKASRTRRTTRRKPTAAKVKT